MPLSDVNKQQSQSIEDLIAQLNATEPTENNIKHKSSEQSAASSSVNSNETSESSARKLIKGKRNAGMHHGSAKAASFPKSTSFGHTNNSEPILMKNIISSKKYSKHAKNYGNRGQPKKGGAGGKHTWGKPGCELDCEQYLDQNDPNYDSEDGSNVIMVSTDIRKQNLSNGSKNVQDQNLQVLELKDMDTEIKLVILEYFQNGDINEVIEHLRGFNFTNIRSNLIAYLIQLGLENNNTCKELTSRLLRDLQIELFSDIDDFSDAFDIVLRNLSDITLDNPDAPENTGTFIARAIADKVLSKKYLDRFSSEYLEEKSKTNEHLIKAISSAHLLVDMSQNCLYKLSHIWGLKGGFLAVRELSDKINEIIHEYYDSGDTNEAIRCLKELNVPHFHHEFIYEAIDFSLQKADAHAIKLIVTLLRSLSHSVIVTYDQLKMGFVRIFDLLCDISLDVPNASALLEQILLACHDEGFLNNDILDLAPNRSRKRFVSEGEVM